ncbi:MAG: hypothetical protein KA185_12200 [Vitreoscilla sp.]|nr:hypothetical protein [Vitreoscilla sp.]
MPSGVQAWRCFSDAGKTHDGQQLLVPKAEAACAVASERCDGQADDVKALRISAAKRKFGKR